MEKLIEMLNYYVNACASAKDTSTKRTFYDQATGAVQMYCLMNIVDEPKVLPLWDETYRPRFENLVYGI
jgi:hypothetical protein